MSIPSAATPLEPSPERKIPVLTCEISGEKRTLTLAKCPFTIGRKPEKDLVIGDPRVSRDHAQIEQVGDEYWLVDLQSRHGTFLNGERIERSKLKKNDRMEFGARDGAIVVFDPSESGKQEPSGEWFSQVVELETSGASDLEKLSLFLDAVRKLNATSVLEEVLVTLLEATLRLTHAERAFVFLRDKSGKPHLSAGRDSRGRTLTDESTISHSILNEASSGGEFLITDTSRSSEVSARNSIVAFDLRTVICIPLCRTGLKQLGHLPSATPAAREVMGVLYLDSHFASREVSAVSHDALRAIAKEAAALVENASLVEAEENARKYQQELAIAASIQQGLMATTIPEVPFARVRAKSVACKDVGGDFYDVIRTDEALTVIVADVCGKGISAALLASTLQGMVYSQLEAKVPLAAIATSVNDYFCQKRLGEKYATIIIAQLKPEGILDFINCGHVPPVLVSGSKTSRPGESNLPVGLIPGAVYEAAQCKLATGDRLMLISDGVTEAANGNDEFFGDERLESAASSDNSFDTLVTEMSNFCGDTPNNDDCTVLELTYTA